MPASTDRGRFQPDGRRRLYSRPAFAIRQTAPILASTASRSQTAACVWSTPQGFATLTAFRILLMFTPLVRRVSSRTFSSRSDRCSPWPLRWLASNIWSKPGGPWRAIWAFIRYRTTTPAADFCRPVRMDRSTLSPDSGTKRQISRGKLDGLPHATAGSTTSALDGYGLRGHWPTRPTPYASHPVLVHRLVRLLHASFRPRLATTPLRFAMTSPPSGCQGDFHPRAVEHARHTNKRGRWPKPPAPSACGEKS